MERNRVYATLALVSAAVAVAIGVTALVAGSGSGDGDETALRASAGVSAAPVQHQPLALDAPEGSGVLKRQSLASETGDEGAGGQVEGIKVLGEWVIDIFDPDGTLVSHREFTNDLRRGGATQIVDILTSTASPGRWVVRVQPRMGVQALSGACFENGTSGDTAACILTRTASQQPNGSLASDLPYVFDTLATTRINRGALSARIKLEGEAIAQNDTDIQIVETALGECNSGVTPGSCLQAGTLDPQADGPTPPGNGDIFTYAVVDPPIPVTAGQQIAVTVNIRFDG